MSESLTFAHLSWASWAIRSQSLICPERSEQIAHIRSFVLIDLSKWANSQPWSTNWPDINTVQYKWMTWGVKSDMSELLTFAHLSWATWAIRSQSLICPEGSERIALICSFVLSNLSKWANPNPEVLTGQYCTVQYSISEWHGGHPQTSSVLFLLTGKTFK